MQALEDYFNDIQPCPHCEGLCAREHFGHEPIDDETKLAYLYCEHCGIGREIILIWKNDRWQVDFWRNVSKNDPEDMARFLKHLEATRCAAA